ncbi:MAG: hypothetical protein HKN26_11240 [Acidimicrobiales bacterium]|nr:hypothetical protein [Acidimicrobiales bacterium]
MAKKGPKALTPEHKAALATGRAEGRAVRQYLEALEANKPKRGRRRTPESIAARLERIAEELPSRDPLSRVQLIQERMDLHDELESMDKKIDLSELEAGFVAAAKAYSERKGLTYAAWREAGVSAATLKAAGISRSS